MVAQADCPCAEGVDPEVWADVSAAAHDVLWALSGRRYGPMQLTIRPELGCCCGCVHDVHTERALVQLAPYPPWLPSVYGSCCKENCACSHPEVIRLPEDVTAVDSVTIDGAAVTDWRLEGPYLVRDGVAWPQCQDLCLPSTDPGTFAITYTYGPPMPQLGLDAECQLACEMAKASSGQACALPQRVTSVSRQGISWVMIDPMEFLDKGRTGLYAVDLFLSVVNPNRLKQRARVFGVEDLPGECAVARP